MGAKSGIKSVPSGDEFYTCPTCGYTDGFHVSFRMTGPSEGQIILICPSCHDRFDNGWYVTLGKKG